MKKKFSSISLLLSFGLFSIGLFPTAAQARFAEISLRGYYSKSNYGPAAFATTKRYTIATSVSLTMMTEIELAYTFEDQYYKNAEIQIINTNEQTLSASVIQVLVPLDWMLQPYVKGGAAQFNRRQTGRINGIPTEEVYTKSPSFLVGAGARMFFSQNFSFKLEFVSYMPEFKIAEAKNNTAIEGGFAWRY